MSPDHAGSLPGARAWRFAPTLGAKLVLFGTLVTLAAVASSFVLLSLEIRRQTRSHLGQLVAQNQSTVLELQRRNVNALLWTSRVMTQSPTLRAAMETYETEQSQGASHRPDLLATIEMELSRVRALLDKDLAVITDAEGEVLAISFGRSAVASGGPVLASFPLAERTLRREETEAAPDPTLAEIGGQQYQVGCVPIVLGEFVIGTLTLGDRLDDPFLLGLKRSLQSDALILMGGRVLRSTLDAAPSGAPSPAALGALAIGGGAGPGFLRIGEEDYVATSLPLGADAQAGAATLVLVQSLTQATAAAGRSAGIALLACGAFALVVTGLFAWGVSRSILRPFERFVAFMRTVAETNDHSRRFTDEEGSAEIRSLNQTYTLLMDSLQERERLLLLHAREELVRVERLKETEKLASLGRMLSGAAHEINNPLTGVIGHLDLALHSPETQGKPRERLEKAQREAQRIAALVRSLLKVARRDTGQRSRVDLHALLDETVGLRRHDFDAAGLQMRCEWLPTALVVEANPLELQQVFLNLLNNAYDALKEQARSPALTIRTAMDGDQAVVVFEDGGPGIKEPQKIFDPFFTTKEIGKGTGLGLSISHAIVQAHGGQITAGNRPEGGARFTIALPAAAGRDAAPAAPPVQVALPAPAAPLSARVLVVDDEASIRDLQLAILTSLGTHAIGATTGQEAIQCLQGKTFDLIVSDLKMPGEISGQDLYRWAQRNCPANAGRFLFVTGDTANEATLKFLEATGRPNLLKPFSVEDYVSILRKTLDAAEQTA